VSARTLIGYRSWRVNSTKGETRIWLPDGDAVIFRAQCGVPGRVAIGFGECRGRVGAV
jgi:fumarylacetoacetase